MRLNTLSPHTSPVLELCTRIWPGFGEYDLPLLGLSFLPNAGIYGSSGTPSQKSQSAKIKAKVCHHLLDPASHDLHRVAHLSLNRILSEGAWLFALPDSLKSHISVSSQPTSLTPHAYLDPRHQLHSLRPSHGDRVTRHNLVRDVVHSAANDRASLGLVLEKPGLLIPRDPSDDDRPPGPDLPDPSSPSCRPADIWVPRGPSGGQETWDFSTTSALRLGQALSDPAAFVGLFSSVESLKIVFLNTASQCAQTAISFCPLVIERGSWWRLV